MSDRQALLDLMFAGPPPTVRREQGMRDARAGKPMLSRDPDYARGYILGSTLLTRDAQELEMIAVVEIDGVRL